MIFALQSLVFSLVLLAAPFYQDANRLLEELQKKYETVDDFTSDFKQVTGTGHVITGRFLYKSKDKFRVELDDRIMVSNGENVWNYTPKSNKVIISPVDEDGTSFSMDKYIYSYPEKCKVQYASDDGTDVIIFKPKTAELDFKEVKLWLTNEKIVKQIQLTDLMDNQFTVYLNNIQLNQDLSDEQFSFSPTEGTKVIDLR